MAVRESESLAAAEQKWQSPLVSAKAALAAKNKVKIGFKLKLGV